MTWVYSQKKERGTRKGMNDFGGTLVGPVLWNLHLDGVSEWVKGSPTGLYYGAPRETPNLF